MSAQKRKYKNRGGKQAGELPLIKTLVFSAAPSVAAPLPSVILISLLLCGQDILYIVAMHC